MISFTKHAIFCLVLLVVLQITSAQATSAYPNCAIECLGKADPGSCQLTDNACLCANQPFVQATYACFKSTCTNSDDLKLAYDSAASLCKEAGVTSTIVAAPARRTATPGRIKRRGYPIAVKANSAAASVSAGQLAYFISGGISVVFILTNYL
ncbi:hypothetical protein FRC08_003512 [Ceratobasidium sp. 394]|nr:hypothetical protein FRC08_003512 [Ceratobasidium sp. 394]KAG9098430.1 hypothetical protein FS749_003836 [Ceratobasidium sp. UAMH 11750]